MLTTAMMIRTNMVTTIAAITMASEKKIILITVKCFFITFFKIFPYFTCYGFFLFWKEASPVNLRMKPLLENNNKCNFN